MCVQDAESQGIGESWWVIHGLWTTSEQWFHLVSLRNKTFEQFTKVASMGTRLKEKNMWLLNQINDRVIHTLLGYSFLHSHLDLAIPSNKYLFQNFSFKQLISNHQLCFFKVSPSIDQTLIPTLPSQPPSGTYNPLNLPPLHFSNPLSPLQPSSLAINAMVSHALESH